MDLPVAGQLVEARPELIQRDVDRARRLLDGEFCRMAHVRATRLAG